MYKYETEKDH